MEDEEEQSEVAGPGKGDRGLEHCRGCFVRVVEHEQRRALAFLRGAKRPQGRVRAPGPGCVVDGCPGPLELGRELSGEAGLADALGAAEEGNLGAPGFGVLPALAQPAQLAVATGQQRGATLELARQLARGRAHGEGGVVAEDGLLQLPQLGAGLDPDLLDQRPMRVAICRHRFGLPSGAVEGEHALRVEALVQGVLGDKRLESSEHVGVAPGGEFGVDRQLDRPQMQFLESPDLRPCEGL